jgi:ABC-type antimicrobial peptide transport system permease subunit
MIEERLKERLQGIISKRWRKLRILWKKVYREFRYNRFRSLVIFLSVAIAVGLLVGLANSWNEIEASLEKNHSEMANADVRLQFAPGWIDEGNVTAIENNETLINAAGLAAENPVEGRIYLRAQVQYKAENYTTYWIGLNNTKDNPNKINKLERYEGKNYFEDPSAPKALMDFHFAASIMLGKNVEVGEQVTIFYGNVSFGPIEIDGIVRDAEYTYMVDDQTYMPLMGDLCVLYLPLEWTQEELYSKGQISQKNVINQILVKTEERSNEAADRAIEALDPYLAQQNAYFFPVRYDLTPDYIMFMSDAGLMDRFGYAFGGIGLIIGAIVVYNSLAKLVGSQRTYIGLMEAMGAKRREIILHFVLMGTVLGFLGWILGCVFGFLLSYAITEMIAPVYGFKYTAHVINWELYILAFIATMAIMVAFSTLACLPILRITPREAMTNVYVRAGASRLWFERFIAKIPKLGGFTIIIPLREVFMNKRRSALTAIAIAVSSIVLVASAGFMSSFFYGIDQNYSEYEKYDIQVLFEEDILSQEELVSYVRGLDGVEPDAVEPMLSRGVTVHSYQNGDVEQESAVIQCFWRNSTLRNFHVIRGEKGTSTNRILAGLTLAKDIGLSVDQEISLENQGEVQGMKIGGIVGQLLDNYLLWRLEDLYEVEENQGLFGISRGTVNGVIFNVNEDADLNAIRTQLVSRFGGITAFIDIHKFKETIEAMMETLLVMGTIFAVVGLIVLGVFAFNTVYLSYLDREMEYLALRAIGSKRRSLYKIVGIETIVIAIIGFAMAIPLGYLTSSWIFDYLTKGRWYLPVYIPLEIWIVVAILSIFSVLLAAVAIAWRTNRMKMADVLRNRQIG